MQPIMLPACTARLSWNVLGHACCRHPPFDTTTAGSPSEVWLASPHAGATGLVGSRLVSKLSSQGHAVRVLTRNVGAARAKLPYGRLQFFAPGDWASAFDGATGVVNLAGGRNCPEAHRRPHSCLCANCYMATLHGNFAREVSSVGFAMDARHSSACPPVLAAQVAWYNVKGTCCNTRTLGQL